MKVAEIDEEGSLRLEPNPAAPTARVVDRIPVEADMPDQDGIFICVLLHVVDGRLLELEIYKDDLTEIQKALKPEELRLSHAPRS